MKTTILTVLMFGLSLGFLANPAKADDHRPTSELKPASACPRLFGAPASQMQNKLRREASISGIAQGEHLVNLIHITNWQAPTVIWLKGVELVATAEGSALLEVGELDEGLACEPGMYELKLDHSLGADGRVLAILDHSVLLEHAGVLRYIKVIRSDDPIFRMIWRSTWTVAASRTGGSGKATHSSSRSSSKRPKSKAKSSPRSSRKATSTRRR
jgi:hypothetical protein